MSNRTISKTARPLDDAWALINAIGGCAQNDFDKGINHAVGQALSIIEELGARDPLKPDEEVPTCWTDGSQFDGEAVLDAIKTLRAEPLYEEGEKARGVSHYFLARITCLEVDAGLRSWADPIAVDARRELYQRHEREKDRARARLAAGG